MVVMCAACAEPADDVTEDPGAAEATTEVDPPAMAQRDPSDISCAPQRPRESLAERRSAYDSTQVSAGGATAQICYGRPQMNDREIFGGLVQYGSLWRTGADEPTTIHTPFAADIAGIAVEPGSYSLYTIPGEQEWTVIVNRATSQWGHESTYTADIEAQEVGRATVMAERVDAPVEVFTIRTEPAGDAAHIVLEWENTRVRIPFAAR
jgi:hypothetical protein